MHSESAQGEKEVKSEQRIYDKKSVGSMKLVMEAQEKLSMAVSERLGSCQEVSSGSGG